MFINSLIYGILSQNETTNLSRPNTCVYLNLNSMSYLDNSFLFRQPTFTVCGWMKNPDNNTSAALYGHDNEFVYTTIYNPTTPNCNITIYDSGTNDIFGGNNNNPYDFKQIWVFYIMTRNNTTGFAVRRIYKTTGLFNSYTGTTNTNGIRNGGSPYNFYIGTSRGRNTTASYKSMINSVGYWNRSFTVAEMDEIWNNGNGLSYANLTATQKNGLVGWYDCTSINSNNGVDDNHINGYHQLHYLD